VEVTVSNAFCQTTFNWAPEEVDAGANTNNFIAREYNAGNWSQSQVFLQSPTSIRVNTPNTNIRTEFQVGEPANLEYRTVTSGSWLAPSTWQISSDAGDTWRPAIAVPDGNNSNSILVRTGHTLNNPEGDVQGDQIVVEEGAMLDFDGATFTILDGAGDDLVLNGTLDAVNGNVTINGKMVVSSTGPITTAAENFNGSGQLEIQAGGSMSIPLSGDYFGIGGGLTINNYGNLTWSGSGDFYFNDPNSTINNFNVMTLDGAGNIDITGTSNAINNHGNLYFNFLTNIISTDGTLASISNNAGAIIFDNNSAVTISNLVMFSNNASVTIFGGSTLTVNNSDGAHGGTYNVIGTLAGTAAFNFTGPTFRVGIGGLVSLNNLVFSGNANQNLEGDGSIVNLKMDNAAGITATEFPTVTGTLDLLDGKITPLNKFNLGDAVVVNNARWVVPVYMLLLLWIPILRVLETCR